MTENYDDPPIEPPYSPQSKPKPPTQPQVYETYSTQADLERALAATRSYYGPAILTLVLYWITFWIGGLIANVIYLNSAYNAQKLSGVSPEGKGCLLLLLIFHVILPLVGIILFFLALVGFSIFSSF